MDIVRVFFFFMVFVGQCLAQTSAAQEALMYEHFEKGLAYRYVQKDSSYFYFKKASKLAYEIHDFDSYLGLQDEIIITANYHGDIELYQTSLRKMDSMLSLARIRDQLVELEYWNTAYLSKLALYYNNIKEYNKAKNLFLKIIAAWKKIPKNELSDADANMLYSINGHLGTIYRNQAKYELAENYFLSNISLVNAHELFAPYRDAYQTGVQQMLAQLYTLKGEHKKANDFYEKNLKWSKEFYAKDKKYKNNVLNAYQKITLSYIEQDSLQKALHFLDESQVYLLKDDLFYKDALLLYGDIYAGLNEKQKALEAFDEALDVFTVFRKSEAHQDIANVHAKIAELYLRNKNYQKGLETILKAFNASGADLNLTSLDDNPNPQKVFSKTQLLNILDIKLQLLQGNFQEKNEVSIQNALVETCRHMLRTFDLLKSEFDSKLDKQFLAKKVFPIFHRMMENVFVVYTNDNSPKTLELALNIAEKNKDFILLEALRGAQATQYGNVPKQTLEKEAQLRAEITNLEKKLFDATAADNEFSDALFKQKQEYYGFLDTLKINYPKYHQLKYQDQTLDLDAVRKKVISENGTVISYTMTENDLYAIIINHSKEKFVKLPFNQVDKEEITNFYRLLSNVSINKASNKKIHQLASELYKKVLEKPLTNFNAESLTIIPDGELHYLPFDLLQEKGVYLLETKNIGYANSLLSLLELKEKESSGTNRILAFAPSFSGVKTESPDRQFGKLLYNDDEVEKLQTFFDSETLLKEEATLSNFKTKASRFNVFHLATHASANDEKPDYSYLAFTESKDSTQGNILYIKDLYNMTLHTDMVTLSACQTGIGKLQKGQGMMSLSKGFYYAGAKSLVNTLWKINDKSTVKLMEFFYEELSKGKSKTEALRVAKLKYLESTDDEFLKHPYYWAAFTVSGDTAPIVKSSTWLYYTVFTLLALLGLVYFSRKRKTAVAA